MVSTPWARNRRAHLGCIGTKTHLDTNIPAPHRQTRRGRAPRKSQTEGMGSDKTAKQSFHATLASPTSPHASASPTRAKQAQHASASPTSASQPRARQVIGPGRRSCMLPDSKQALVQIRQEIQPVHSTNRFRACVRTLAIRLGATHGPGWTGLVRRTYPVVDDQAPWIFGLMVKLLKSF